MINNLKKMKKKFIIYKLYENLTSNYYMMFFLVGGREGGGY
jgi:hypothetical protein